VFARLEKALWAVGTASALLLASVAPAQAAVYTGKWDPVFGAPFSPTELGAGNELAWTATATLVVPDSCLTVGGGNAIIDFSTLPNCDGGGTRAFLSAKIEFYNALSPTNLAQQETLVFQEALFEIEKLHVVAGEIVGVQTDTTAPVRAMNAIAGGGAYWFQPIFGLGAGIGGSFDTFVLYQKDLSTSTTTSFQSATNALAAGQKSQFKATDITFVRVVPEPGSMALVLAALGAGWAVRRRRA
jgi:hypothetical protein